MSRARERKISSAVTRFQTQLSRLDVLKSAQSAPRPRHACHVAYSTRQPASSTAGRHGHLLGYPPGHNEVSCPIRWNCDVLIEFVDVWIGKLRRGRL